MYHKYVKAFVLALIMIGLFSPHFAQCGVPLKLQQSPFLRALKTPWPYVIIASCAIVGVGLGFGIKYLKDSKDNDSKN
jgi:hypothetical protein